MSEPPPFPPDMDDVRQALSRLSFLDREVILLKARDGLTYEQIGAVLGLPAAAVETRMAQALARLRGRLLRPRRTWWRPW